MSEVIHGIIYILVAALSYIFWRKYKDGDWFLFMWLGLIAASFDVLAYFVKYVFSQSETLVLIVNSTFLILDPVIVILVLVVLVRKRRRDQ